MESSSFEKRCIQYADILQAIGVITGLRYGETPYLLAIAGCTTLIKQRS